MPTPSLTLSPPGLRARPLAHVGLLALVLTAVAGCASVTPSSAPAEPTVLPTAWAGSSAPAPHAAPTPLAHWWRRFNDPLLSTLIEQALQANTSVEVARATLQQSRALRDVKAAALQPSVSGSGAAKRSQTEGSAATNSLSTGLDVSWTPDVFGANKNLHHATQADALAAETSLADVQVSVAAEVALAYIQLRGVQSQLQIAQTNLANQAETLQITDWRAQAGLSSSLDVAQARISTEQTAAQLPSLQTSLGQSRYSLAVLTGQTPNSLRAVLATRQPIPQAPADLTLAIPAQTLRQRADVRTAEHRITAALARMNAAQADRYPSFSLSGSLDLTGLTLGALTSGAATLTNTLLASISIPLLDGGSGAAQVQAQSAALDQAHASYKAALLNALKEVEDALIALQGEQTRLVRLQDAATAAEHAALLAQQRYASGLIDFQTVLQTQRTLLTTQDNVASSQSTLSANQVRLYQALGGGWL